ncbi:hypothetical protein [Catenibacterium sp.]
MNFRIDTDVLCIDGTKYEANANKNTFIWRKNTVSIGKTVEEV